MSGASVATLWNRVGYGGKKGRRAARRLSWLAMRPDRHDVWIGMWDAEKRIEGRLRLAKAHRVVLEY